MRRNYSKIIATEISLNTRPYDKVTVIRDDLLPGGTKIRGLIPYFEHILKDNPKIREFIYASPAYGYAQVAISLASKIIGKQCTIFVAKRKEKHPNTEMAMNHRAKIVEVPYGYLVVVKKYAMDYARDEPTRYLLPWGLTDPLFKEYLRSEISKNLPHNLFQNNVKKIWITIGSGTLFETLASVIPEPIKFNLVIVGADYNMENLPDSIYQRIVNVYRAPEKFEQKARIMPPFPSNPWYDAKLWRFVEEEGEEGDIIWNVA